MNIIERKLSPTNTTLDSAVNKFRITVILGEVDSGKTTLLNEFYGNHKDITMYKSMIALTNKDTIDNTIQFIVLDALDEALYQKEEEEVLKNLLDFIIRCRDINSHVKFVISCCNAIWKKEFEEQLQKIDTKYQELQQNIKNLSLSKKLHQKRLKDRSIKKYTLEPLSQDEINLYLGNKSDTFWNFVEKNHLMFVDNFNIYHILHLCDNFEQYERKCLKYFEIYNVIIRQHLQAFSDNQRNRQLDSISIDELFKIASVVAFYNVKYKSRFSFATQISEELKSLCSSIDISIDKKKLKILGDTTLLYLLENASADIQQIKSYLAAYYLKDFDESIIIEQTISRSGIVDGYENMVLHLKHLKPSFLENYFKDLDMTKITNNSYKLFIYTNPSYDKVFDVWNSIVDSKSNFKEIVYYDFRNDNKYCKALFTFIREKDLFKESPILLYDESIKNLYKPKRNYQGSFELNLLENLYFQTILLDDLLYLIQFISENEFQKVFDLLEENEWMLMFEAVDKEYLELNLDKSLINMLIKNILSSFSEETVLLKVISFLEKYEITIKDIYFKDFQSNQIEILWNLYFREEKNIFVYFPNLLHFLKKQSEQYPINSYVEAYKKLYSEYCDSIIATSRIEWDFLLENENFKEEKEAYDEEYPSWDSYIKQEGKKEEVREVSDEFYSWLNEFKKKDFSNSSKETLQSCLGIYYDTFMQRLKDEFTQVHFTRNGIKEQEGDYFIEYQYDSEIWFSNIFKKFSTEEMNDFFDTKEMYNKLFCFVSRSEKCQKSFFSKNISSKMSFLHKKYKESFIENIKNYIDYWLQNLEVEQMPSFLCNLSDVKEFTIDEITPLLVYMKSSKLLRKQWSNLSRDDKQFLLNLLEKEQSNFEFIFELMKKDIQGTTFYLNRLLDMNLEKTVDNFIIYYNEEGKKQALYDGFVDSLKKNVLFNNYFENDEKSTLKKKVMECLAQNNIKAFLVDGYSFYENPSKLVFWDYLDKETLEELSKNKNFKISSKAEELLKPMYDKEVRSKEIEVKHSPDKLVNILKLFTKENPIKYTSHSFEWSKYGSYQNFIDKVQEEFKKIDDELKMLSLNLHTKISNFLFEEFETWGKYKIAFGWSSPKLKEWCEIEEKKNNAKKAISFPLPKEHQYEIDGKTLTTFDDICTVFKDEIEIRDDDRLNKLFEKIEEDVLGFVFEVEYINLENITFYTDVEYFENAVTKIFEQFKERVEHDSILVEADNKESYVDIIIEQRGSTVNKSSEEMKKEIDNGDFEDIKKYLFSLCDWSIEVESDLYGNFRVEYLSENQAVKVVELEEKPQGFRHILRFYK